MKNKGFTLVELIGVVVIIGLIAVFSVPALTKTIKESAEKEYNEYAKNIELAAENYFHSETDGVINGKYFIKVGTLFENGYLKKQVNPKTNQETSEDATIIVTKNSDGTEFYEFVDFDATENGYEKDGLILLYDGYNQPIDGIWKDLSGNGNDGTVYGAIWDKDHVYFDGENDWIHIGEYNYNNITMDFVIELSQYSGLIFGNPETGGCYINCSTSTLSGACYSGGYKIVNYNSTELNRKYNISLVLNASSKTMTFYVNGNIVGTQVVNAFTYPNDNTHLVLGANPYGSGVSHEFFKGNIYGVRYYNRALTDDEVYANYQIDKYRFDI